MAEGGGYNVSVRGSDAEFEYTCTPCTEDGSNQEAVKYCPECKEFLCAACTKCHKKFSATKKHILLEKDFQKHKHTVETSVGVVKKREKCAAHVERDIEMYCGSHDMVYCALCIAKDHRSCPNVFEIKEAVERFSVQPDDITVAKVENVAKKLAETKQNKNENVKSIEMESNNILINVEGTKEKLIKHVKKLAGETTVKVNAARTNLKQELENERDTIDENISLVENCRRQLCSLKQFDKSEQFVQQKLQKGVLRAAETLLGDAVQYESKKITFKENDVLIDQILTATSLVQTEEKRCQTTQSMKLPPSVKSKQVVNVRVSGDENTCCIYGICQLPGGTIVLTDYKNYRLKRLDNQYKVSDHLDLDSKPTGICCIGTNEVAIKQVNNKVQFVSVGRSMSKTSTFDIDYGDYLGFIYFANTLWSYTVHGLNIFSTSGTKLKSLKDDTFWKHLFPSSVRPKIFPVCSDRTFVYVSDFDNIVACLDADENVKAMLADPSLKGIRAACISSNDVVFVAGFSSNNIMMFESDGKCLGELVTVSQPQYLCYDSEKDKLIVGCYGDNNIVVIDLEIPRTAVK
ncbi:uncharacterized protein LOC123549614 [Mercenaria mercenaria]|uniref:uncharacterized protein LOC123549614 n=1 Tax=Mercenaria mercenaria TaxID=6596 RepID=UPI00234F5D02|nr:uncharacterized protein LOC123549614 [Mercenaria mercenaria]